MSLVPLSGRAPSFLSETMDGDLSSSDESCLTEMTTFVAERIIKDSSNLPNSVNNRFTKLPSAEIKPARDSFSSYFINSRSYHPEFTSCASPAYPQPVAHNSSFSSSLFQGSLGLSEDEVTNLYPTSLSNRRYPPTSLSDSSVPGKAVKTDFLKHEEIKVLHPSVRRETLDSARGIYADYTENNKSIIQQQAKGSCTAACTAMLICDLLGASGVGDQALHDLSSRHSGSHEDQRSDLSRAGLNVYEGCLEESLKGTESLASLRLKINAFGSAIIGVGTSDSGLPVGGHAVILDDISEDLSAVRLRDPYHGWEITIGADVFLRIHEKSGHTIQAALKST